MATTTGVRAPVGHRRTWTLGDIGDREVEIALGVAMVASVGLALLFSRGTTFSVDELDIFSIDSHLGLRTALEPYNGHLILIQRLVYAAVLSVFGPGYLPFRLLAIGAVLLTAGLFFVYARRRVGSLIALAPTLVLLFFGTDSKHALSGNGFGVVLPLGLGIGALLALEREDRAGDVAACILLCLAIATYSVALAFVGAVAVLVLIGADRWRRAWVFLVPAVLYAAWLLWSRNMGGNTENSAHVTHLLLFPNWAANSLATVGAALTGLNYAPFGNGWGPVVATIAAVALAWRLWRGNIPKWLWAAMAVPTVLWLIGAATEMGPTPAHPAGRLPNDPRYIFAGTIGVLLVAAEAARGVRLDRRGMLVVYAIAAMGLATNLTLLRQGGADLRGAATATRAHLTAVEIGGGRLGTRLRTELGAIPFAGGEGNIVTGYMSAERQFGSPAFSLAELHTQSAYIRQTVDGDLANSYGLHLQPASGPFSRCRQVTTTPGVATSLKLPPGGAVLRTSGTPAPVTLRRFGPGFTVQAGTLQPGAPAALPIPRDSAPDPWYASTTTGPLTVCGPPSA